MLSMKSAMELTSAFLVTCGAKRGSSAASLLQHGRTALALGNEATSGVKLLCRIILHAKSLKVSRMFRHGAEKWHKTLRMCLGL